MNYTAVKKFMLEKLQKELPLHLSYHSVGHVKDVLDAAINLSEKENINNEEKTLVKTAAVFHDSGFLFGSKDHEERSCELAKKYLPEYDYNAGQIEKICGMIMATKIPQTPHNQLEEILADADLDYLGRDDFFTIGNRLYEEMALFNIVNSEDDWNRLQIKFFEAHHYFTPTAIALRGKKKEEHLQIIKSKLD